MSRQVLGRQRTDSPSTRDPHRLTLLQLVNDVLRRSPTVVAFVVLCAAAAAVLSLARPRTYTSITSFVGEARQPLSAEVGNGSSLEGLSLRDSRAGSSRVARLLGARNTGMSFSSLAPPKTLDPGFYYTTLRSPEILTSVAAVRFSIPTPTGVQTVTAADVYGLPPGPAITRVDKAARRLARDMVITYEERSRVLTLSVRTPHPAFSQAVVTRLLDALQERNRQMGDSRAQAQVVFLERAASAARQELRVVQNRLARFLESNRAYVPASPLAMAYRRLDSDVLDKRRQYADLALQLERAKLDRSRATQLVTVVVRPEVPSRPDARGTLRTTVAGAIGGGALALLLVLTNAHLARLRAAGSDDLSALEAEWRTVGRRSRAGSTLATASSPTVTSGVGGS